MQVSNSLGTQVGTTHSMNTGEWMPIVSLSWAVSCNHFFSEAKVSGLIFLAASRTESEFTLSPYSFSPCLGIPCFPDPTTKTPLRMKPWVSRFPGKPRFQAGSHIPRGLNPINIIFSVFVDHRTFYYHPGGFLFWNKFGKTLCQSWSAN